MAIVDQLEKWSKDKRRNDNLEIRVWCDRKFAKQARALLAGKARVDIIAAGKLRRYANLSFWYKWFSPYHIIHTHIPNLIDIFKIIGGFVQSLIKLALWRPDVVFCKGGYVCLPVGIVAHLYHIPLVIHDSDTVPGLTNRVLSRYANAIGTGSPIKNYPSYPKSRTEFVGIPVRPEIKHVSDTAKIDLKRELGFDGNRPLVLAMGGGLGATEINQAMVRNADKLIKNGLDIYLLTGRGKMVTVKPSLKAHFRAVEFSDHIATIEQAADIVVTRAGATTMAELAVLRAATIIVPSPYLAGDHQTKNAKAYEADGAAVVINQFDLEKRPGLLLDVIMNIANTPSQRRSLQANLAKFAKPDALNDMVTMITRVINN